MCVSVCVCVFFFVVGMVPSHFSFSMHFSHWAGGETRNQGDIIQFPIVKKSLPPKYLYLSHGHNSSCMYVACKRGIKEATLASELWEYGQGGCPKGSFGLGFRPEVLEKMVMPIKDAHHIRKMLNFGDPHN